MNSYTMTICEMRYYYIKICYPLAYPDVGWCQDIGVVTSPFRKTKVPQHRLK